MASNLKIALVVAALCALLVLIMGHPDDCMSRCNRLADSCKRACGSDPQCAHMCATVFKTDCWYIWCTTEISMSTGLLAAMSPGISGDLI